jgi:hypothetical protein
MLTCINASSTRAFLNVYGCIINPKLQSHLVQLGGGGGCGGGGGRGPNTCAIKPITILPGRDCRIKQCKERLATSLKESLVSIIALRTFRSGHLMRVLMTFLSLAG